jgi:hypothetical protein
MIVKTWHLLIVSLLCGCSMGQKILTERTTDPVTGKLTGCRTTVTTGEDKAGVGRATRTVNVDENCAVRINFGSSEENAGDQTAKAISAVLGGITPLLKTVPK